MKRYWDKQRAEITISLTIISVIFMIVGMIAGQLAVQQKLQTRTLAYVPCEDNSECGECESCRNGKCHENSDCSKTSESTSSEPQPTTENPQDTPIPPSPASCNDCPGWCIQDGGFCDPADGCNCRYKDKDSESTYKSCVDACPKGAGRQTCLAECNENYPATSPGPISLETTPTISSTPISSVRTCPAFEQCPQSPVGEFQLCPYNPSQIEGDIYVFSYQCMPDGKWEKQLDFAQKKEIADMPCTSPGDSGVDKDNCRYVCKFNERKEKNKYVKENPDCPVNTECYSDETDNLNGTCPRTCINGHWQNDKDCYFPACDRNIAYNVFSDGTMEQKEACKRGCEKGKCLPEDTFCEGSDVVASLNGKKMKIDTCPNGCNVNMGSCREIFYGKCDDGDRMVFPNNCVYTCHYGINDLDESLVYWDKNNSQCRELYGQEVECRENNGKYDVYDVKYEAGLDRSTQKKSCDYGCSHGECTYPTDIPCIEGQRQFSEDGTLVECKKEGSQTVWKINNFNNLEIIAQGLSDLERQTLLYTLADLPSSFWGKDKLKKIIISETFTEEGVQNKTGNYAWYKIKSDEIFLPDWGVNNPGVIVHELAHSQQFCKDCSSFMDAWRQVAGWTKPNSSGSGITNSSPQKAPSDYAKTNEYEDMAESVSLYYTNPCDLKQNFPERYNFLKDSPRLFDGKEYLPAGGCPVKTSLNHSPGFYAFSLVRPVYATPVYLSPLSMNKIIPGKSTEDEVLNILGTPTSKQIGANRDIFWYETKDIHYQTIIFMDNIVYFMTTHLGEKSTDNISKYGKPNTERYNYYSEATKTYFYFDQGLALTADVNGKILVKQSFVPKSPDEFLAEWGKEYPPQSPYSYVKIFKAGDKSYELSLPTPTPTPFYFMGIKLGEVKSQQPLSIIWEIIRKIIE